LLSGIGIPMIAEGSSMSDIRLEKCIETVYEHMRGRLPEKLRDRCPAVDCIASILIAMKAEVNAEVALEMGLTSEGIWKCACRK